MSKDELLEAPQASTMIVPLPVKPEYTFSYMECILCQKEISVILTEHKCEFR